MSLDQIINEKLDELWNVSNSHIKFRALLKLTPFSCQLLLNKEKVIFCVEPEQEGLCDSFYELHFHWKNRDLEWRETYQNTDQVEKSVAGFLALVLEI